MLAQVVSCEMIEAVGQENLPAYFRAISGFLKPGGQAVIQVHRPLPGQEDQHPFIDSQLCPAYAKLQCRRHNAAHGELPKGTSYLLPF